MWLVVTRVVADRVLLTVDLNNQVAELSCPHGTETSMPYAQARKRYEDYVRTLDDKVFSDLNGVRPKAMINRKHAATRRKPSVRKFTLARNSLPLSFACLCHEAGGGYAKGLGGAHDPVSVLCCSNLSCVSNDESRPR